MTPAPNPFDQPPPQLNLPPHATLLLRALQLARKTTIVDVGANPAHVPPYAALLRAGGCHVVGFEPLPAAFALLQRDKGPDETYHNIALGDGRRQKFHIYRVPTLSSLFPPHLPGCIALAKPRWAAVDEVIDIDTTALDAVPDLTPFDLLKIDIQGGEAMVLAHARTVLREAVAVIVELRYMQIYEGEPMLSGVDEELRAQGFMLHKFLANKSVPLRNSQSSRLAGQRNRDQLVDGDAVYLRHPGHIAALTDAQLMHLAILAAAVFASHTAVIAALDELVRRVVIAPGLPGAYVDALPPEFRKNAD